MIRLDSRASEKEQIFELISSAIDNRDYELECLFNNPSSRASGNRSYYHISHNNFMSILKRFKANPEFEVKTQSRLAITFPDSNPMMRGVRVLVKGQGAINAYCNSDSFASIINSVDMEMKTRPKTRLVSLEISNYNIKFNLKQEVNFNNDTARVRDIQREWSNVMKNYRYKKTFSFIHKGGGFQVDVSIVKASSSIDRFITVDEVIKNNLIRSVVKPSDVKMGFGSWWRTIENRPDEKVLVRNGSDFFKNIKESSVFTNAPTYEVEVEYIRNKTAEKPRFKNLDAKKEYITREFQGFFRYIGAVLQCIQGSNYILSSEEKATVHRNFSKVVLDSITEDLLVGSGKTDDTRSGAHKRAEANKMHMKKQRGGFELDMDGDIDFTRETEGQIETNKIVGREQETETQTRDERESEEDEAEQNFQQTGGGYGRVNTDDDDEPNSDAETGINQAGGARRIAELKSMITKQFQQKGIFFGPLIVDLSANQAIKLDPEALPDIATNTNIQINYLVTDKTDGERNLMFIDSKGVVYGIDRESNIKSLGLVMPSLRDTILDGELVSRTEDGRVLNNFYIFDAYIYQGKCIMHRPFLIGRPEGRHHAIVEVVKYFETGNNIVQTNEKLPLLIYKKDYLPGNSARTYEALDPEDQTQMQLNCERLLNKMNQEYGGYLEVGHLFPYKTDGLVFLPNNMGVFQSREGASAFDANSAHPFKAGRWNLNYKWKPADLLTVDFRVDFLKSMDKGTVGKTVYEYRGDQKYVRVQLKTAIYQNRVEDNNALNFYLLNSGVKLASLPESYPFFAVNPFLGEFESNGIMKNYMSDALFLVDANDNVYCHSGDILTDGQIVECAYDRGISEEQLRWHPHRVRADKQSPNSYLVAAASWYLINNPITLDFLSGVVPKTEGSLGDVVYYSDNKETTFLTKPLNDFNTGFVKSYLINRALTGYIRPKVLDLAVGKFSDMSKYVHGGANTVVGLEIGYDGLNNPVDGGCKRMLEWAKRSPAVAKLADRTMLIVGDATKNISNSNCARDNLNRYYLDVLYGRMPGNTPKLKKLEGVALEGFDVVSCMYAIHYMMDNEDTLDAFLRNVSENLLDQGYFIGTCLDGMAILREMGRSQELSGVIGDKTIFKIKKMDTSTDAYKNITVGSKVLVYYEKFAGQFPENLVNMSYLRERARAHNLKLLEYRTFLEEPGNLLSQFETSHKKEAAKIQDEDALMTWAGFNAYFIFQKVRD
jgi:hypothetical protein